VADESLSWMTEKGSGRRLSSIYRKMQLKEASMIGRDRTSDNPPSSSSSPSLISAPSVYQGTVMGIPPNEDNGTDQQHQISDSMVEFDDACDDIAWIAPFIIDETKCEDIISKYESQCCPPPQPPTLHVEFCSVCPIIFDKDSNSTNKNKWISFMGDPERSVPFSGGKTCRDIDDELHREAMSFHVESCDSARKMSFGDYLDPFSFCSCYYIDLDDDSREPSFIEAPNICSFCAVDMMQNPNFVVREDDIPFTCRDAAELAPFVSEHSFCLDVYASWIRGCGCSVSNSTDLGDGTGTPNTTTNLTDINKTTDDKEEEQNDIDSPDVLWLAPIVFIAGSCLYACLKKLDALDDDGPDLAGARWRQEQPHRRHHRHQEQKEEEEV
jgi:hypothetical protein